ITVEISMTKVNGEKDRSFVKINTNAELRFFGRSACPRVGCCQPQCRFGAKPKTHGEGSCERRQLCRRPDFSGRDGNCVRSRDGAFQGGELPTRSTRPNREHTGASPGAL